jgi:hypothetical protein
MTPDTLDPIDNPCTNEWLIALAGRRIGQPVADTAAAQNILATIQSGTTYGKRRATALECGLDIVPAGPTHGEILRLSIDAAQAHG